MEGKDIFVPAEDLCHVAFAGKTGGGKGSLMRLILAQLCYVGARVLLLNPHYMRWVCAKDGGDFDEDWTPFEGLHPGTKKPYLMQSPLDCADYKPIGHYLQWTVKTLLEQRKAKGREGGQRFKPFFLVIDEWPSISSEIKEASDALAKILREGRKYGIFVIIASQDFQARTLRMESGSVRKCFLTVFYTGGDLVSVKELLNDKVLVNENDLGKGVVLLRCSGTGNQPMLVRVPFVDNEAVYRLLGSSTFSATTASEDDEERHAPVTPYAPYPQADACHVSNATKSRQEGEYAAQMEDMTIPPLTRQTGPLSGVIERAHATSETRQPHYKLMSERQAHEFVALYRVRPNMDSCLKTVGCSSLYRQHARQLIQEHGLNR
jgi:hypothetical protein